MTAHEQYMRRCFQLAKLGKGMVSPNPMVGCVIVHQDKIIGEGFHERFGGPHAEINALNSVYDKSVLPKAKLYVNLEPCTHHGKTPPCADALIDSGIKEVFIASLDPNPDVSSRNGVQLMRDAGIKVELGILKKEAHYLNRRFYTFHQFKRPYIILKWAASIDGFIGDPKIPKVKISNIYSRKLTHRWRAEEDAIMAGTTTVSLDNPRLNVRFWKGENPVKITIDLKNKLRPDLNFFKGKETVLIYSSAPKESTEPLTYIPIDTNEPIVPQILNDLYFRGIQSVLVEGGGTLINTFLQSAYWDEMRQFTGNVFLNKGVPAPMIETKQFEEMPIFNDRLYYIQHQLEPTQ